MISQSYHWAETATKPSSGSSEAASETTSETVAGWAERVNFRYFSKFGVGLNGGSKLIKSDKIIRIIVSDS